LVDQARRRHRKGALSALRDSTLLKTVYAYGLFSGAPAACVSAIL
jgi:hypothetical protein